MSPLVQRVTRRFLARAIRLDTHRIRELAKELEEVVAKETAGVHGPLGSTILVSKAPYEATTVDGRTLPIFVRLQSVETRNKTYGVSGGKGHDAKGAIYVVVNINGSIPAEDLWLAASARRGYVADDIYPILVHELTHAADKYQKEPTRDERKEKAYWNDDKSYWNHPGEVRAYMREVVEEATERFPTLYPTLSKHFGPGRGLQMLIQQCPTWTEGSEYWTESNKRLVLKAVAQALEEWQASNTRQASVWRDLAIDKMYAPVMQWIHSPNTSGKKAVFETYEALRPQEKAAYDADVVQAFQRAHHGSTTIAYRYKDRPSHMGGMSLTTDEPTYLSPDKYSVYELHASDVLVHWGQSDMPLAGKAFGHEHEVILRPDANPKPVAQPA